MSRLSSSWHSSCVLSQRSNRRRTLYEIGTGPGGTANFVPYDEQTLVGSTIVDGEICWFGPAAHDDGRMMAQCQHTNKFPHSRKGSQQGRRCC
mmetsp:Transcript_3750/g.5860  ORF Transcript_3750/g.5860 Transcript_3750/m.5860 type:complete len:93 (+) Transcript_3750:170-448(+)